LWITLWVDGLARFASAVLGKCKDAENRNMHGATY
jgi:hypothetical protein